MRLLRHVLIYVENQVYRNDLWKAGELVDCGKPDTEKLLNAVHGPEKGGV